MNQEEKSLDYLCRQYSEDADIVKDHLQQMIELISPNFVPKNVDEHLQLVVNKLEHLHTTYNEIREQARKVLQNENLPDENAPITDYLQAINSKLKNQIESITRLCLRFISVSSNTEEYREKLKPYQLSAQSIVESISSNEPISESTIEKTYFYDLFLQMVSELTRGSEEWDDAYDYLDEKNAFHKTVMKGLRRKGYFIPEEKSDIESDSTNVSCETSTEEDPNVDNSPLSEESSNTPEYQEEKVIDDKNETVIPEIPEEPFSIPETLRPNNQIKKKDGNAKGFDRLLDKAPHIMYESFLLPLFLRFGALSLDDVISLVYFQNVFSLNYEKKASKSKENKVRITDLKGFLEESDDSEQDEAESLVNMVGTLNYLEQNNVISCYDLPAPGSKKQQSIFCLTQYGYDCLNKQSIQKKALNNKYSRKSFWTDPYTHNNYFVAKDELPSAIIIEAAQKNHMLICCMISMVKNHLKTDTDLSSMMRSIKWDNNRYSIDIAWENEIYNCLLLRSLSEADATMDSIIIGIQDSFQKSEVSIMAQIPTIFMLDENKEDLIFMNSEPDTDDEVYDYAEEDYYQQPEPASNNLANQDQTDTEEYNSQETSKDDDTCLEEKTNEEATKADTNVETSTDFVAGLESVTSTEDNNNETIQEQTQQREFQKTSPDVDSETDIVHKEDCFSGEDILNENNIQKITRLWIENEEPIEEEKVMQLASLLIKQAPVSSLNELPVNPESVHNYREILQSYLLLQAFSLIGYNNCESAYKQLNSALRVMPVLDKNSEQMSSAILGRAFTDNYLFSESAKLAAYCQALTFPRMAYDYALNANAKELLDNFSTEFSSFTEIKSLFEILTNISEYSWEGFSDRILAKLGDMRDQNSFFDSMKQKAESYQNSPQLNIEAKRTKHFSLKCFGEGSTLYDLLQFVIENDKDNCGLVTDKLKEYCIIEKNGDDAEFMIDEEKINEIIDREWKNLYGFELNNKTRDAITRYFYDRIELIISWVMFCNNDADNNMEELRKLKISILASISRAEKIIKRKNPETYPGVVLWSLQMIKEKLQSNNPQFGYFGDLLYSGFIPMDEYFRPEIDPLGINIGFYEPWRNILRYIATDSVTDVNSLLESVTDFNQGSDLFDNLNQLSLLKRFIPQHNLKDLSENDIENARKLADTNKKDFLKDLSLAYTYEQIKENDHRELESQVNVAHEYFRTQLDFGCFRQVISALQKQVLIKRNEYEKENLETLEKVLRTCSDEERNCQIINKARELLSGGNFVLFNEYLMRFQHGERNLDYATQETNSFDEFFSDEVFESIWEKCVSNKGGPVSGFGTQYMEKNRPKDWTKRNIENSKNFLKFWIKRNPNNDMVRNIFESLGFTVSSVTPKDISGKAKVYSVSLEQTPKNRGDYVHPISIFGTQMPNMLNVVLLYGGHNPKEIINTITNLNLGKLSIVLLDYHLDRPERRQLAELFYCDTNRTTPFILIDRILWIYLSLKPLTERIPVLLQCTLPFTFFQPFIKEGSVADEMFVGRVRELEDITNFNGSSIVYGGRQLGKTALLFRARSLFSKPEEKDFAVYSNMEIAKNESDFVETLAEDICSEIGITDYNSTEYNELKKCRSTKDLCRIITILLSDGKVERLLLLIDETNKLIDEFGKLNYEPLVPLITLKKKYHERFKFVIAGLHNICRAENTNISNSPFGQLGASICIEPLSPMDAYKLVTMPMKYMGFKITKDDRLESILTASNYYPGVLHYFGYILIDKIVSQYAEQDYSALRNNPPFQLSEDQFGNVMNSPDVKETLKQKFTLTLDLDPRYHMLARCITYMYHFNNPGGDAWITINDLHSIIESYKILCLSSLSEKEIINLLDELVSMGILIKNNGASQEYRLRRRSFVDLIGPDFDALEKEIYEENERLGYGVE